MIKELQKNSAQNQLRLLGFLNILPPGWERLGGSTMAFTIANFGTKALSFVLLIPLYTRFLNPAEFGIVSLSEALAVAVSTIYASAFEISIQRFYHRYTDPNLRRACVSTLLQVGAVVIIAVCTPTLLFGTYLHHLLPRFNVPFYPYVALAIGTFALNQVISYRLVLYLAEQRAKAYMSLSLTLFFATAVGIITFVVLLRAGAVGMLLGKFVPTGIMALCAIFLLRKWLVLGWHRETLREFKRFSAPMSAYPFIVLGLNVADRLILQRYRSMAEVGIYSLAYGVGMAMSLVALSLYQSWTPLFYKTAALGKALEWKNAKLLTVALLINVMFAIAGVAVSPLFVSRLLDSRYRDAAVLVPYIIVGYLLRSFTYSFHVPVLVAGKTLAISISGAIALIVNIAINFAFIPRYGIYAAAYATVIAYAVELVAVYMFAQRVYPLPYPRTKLVAGMILLALTLAVSESSIGQNLLTVGLTALIAIGSVMYMIRGVTRWTEPRSSLINV